MALLISNLDFKVVNLDTGIGGRKSVVACNMEEASLHTDCGAFLAWSQGMWQLSASSLKGTKGSFSLFSFLKLVYLGSVEWSL